MSSSSSSISIYNPRELFKEFADEIYRKQFENKDNKKFFIDSINSFSKLKIESINHLKSTLTLIKQQFQNPNFQYLLHLLSKINKLLSDNKIGLNCVDELKKNITNDTELNDNGSHVKNTIQILTKLIIFELIHKKYSIEYIKNIINDIFSNHTTLDDALLSIKKYYSKKSEKITYIFQLKRLKGEIDVTFGNVRIYNPQHSKYSKSS